MADVYFTATQAKRAARIVSPSVARAGQLKAMLEAKGVQTGGIFSVGASFERSKKEERDALAFLNLIL
jgi:hypothetical protein